MKTFAQFGNRPTKISEVGTEFIIMRGEDDVGEKGEHVAGQRILLQHYQYVVNGDDIHMTQETYDFLTNAEIIEPDQTFPCVQNLPVRIVPPGYPVAMGAGWTTIGRRQTLVAKDGFAYMTQPQYNFLLATEEDDAVMRAGEALVEAE